MKPLKIASLILLIFAVSFVAVRVSLSKTQESKKPKPEFDSFTPEPLARLRAEQSSRDEALEKAQAEVLADPQSAVAHFNLAEAYKKNASDRVSNRMDKIANEYEQAIRLKPDYAEAYNGLANIYGQMNEFKKQFEAFDKAISLKPDFAEAYCNLGFAHLWNNIAKSGYYPNYKAELRLAVDALQKAIRIKPDYSYAYRGLAEAYALQKRNTEAVDAYKQAIFFTPNDWVVHLDLGRLYIELGDRTSALQEHQALVLLEKELDDDFYADILLKEINYEFGKSESIE